MFSVLATSASTDCAAGGGLYGVGMLLLLLAVVGAGLVIWAGSHRPEERRQPPAFRPVEPAGDTWSAPRPGTPPGASAPVNVHFEIDQVDIVDVPSTDRVARRLRN